MRRLGAGRHLEAEHDAVEGEFLSRVPDLDGGRHEPRGAGGRGESEAHADEAPGAPLQVGPRVVGAAAQHRRARVHVLRDGVFHEALGSDDGNAVVGSDDAEHAAEVVEVGVGEHDGGDRPFTALRPVQVQGGGRRLGGGERVDDHDTVVALDQRHVGEVEPACLEDALRYLEQTGPRAELGLPPQVRVRGVGTVLVEERRVVEVPHDAPVLGRDRRGQRRGDEAPVRLLEVGPVGEVGEEAGVSEVVT